MGLDFGQWQMRNFRADATEDLARYASNPHVQRDLRDAFPYPYAYEKPKSKPATEAMVSRNGFRYSDRNLRLWLEREEIPQFPT